MNQCNWENRTLFLGDKLHIMREMNSSSVDLIVTDSALTNIATSCIENSGTNSGTNYKISEEWNGVVNEVELDKLEDDCPSVMSMIEGTKHSFGKEIVPFLIFMAVHLREMYRILKDTGIIYLHCPISTSYYLKAIMDEKISF